LYGASARELSHNKENPMSTFTVTMPTAEEAAQLREANPSNKKQYAPPADGYVRPTTIAKVLNELLVKADHGDRVVPSQLVYNYVKKGYLKTDDQNYPHVPVANAEAWIKLQFARRTEVSASEPESEEEEDSTTDNDNENEES
jgi:hypothetical protein